jgi:hypothetical protein
VRPIRAFGTVPCEKIAAANIQRLQAEMKGSGCKGSYVNLVVGATGRVLRFAKTWRRIRDEVIRLPERTKPVASVLTPEQKARRFQVAASNPN